MVDKQRPREKNKNVRHEVCVVVLESKCIQECVASIETIEANLVSDIEKIGEFMKDNDKKFSSLGNLQEKLKGFFDKIKNDFVVELVETKAPDNAKDLPETPPTPVPSAPPMPEPSAPPKPEPSAPPKLEPSAPPKLEPNFVHHVQNTVYIHKPEKKRRWGIFVNNSANKTHQYETSFQSFVSGGLPHGQGLHVSNQISVRS
uniref:FH2 domain-containing protein n=1 Tax=Meloidogyne hapla TaxID=6305 RepID=A0A1I8BL69_MELHA